MKTIIPAFAGVAVIWLITVICLGSCKRNYHPVLIQKEINYKEGCPFPLYGIYTVAYQGDTDEQIIETRQEYDRYQVGDTLDF